MLKILLVKFKFTTQGTTAGSASCSKVGRREEGTLRQARTRKPRGAGSREAEEKGDAKETPQDNLAFDKGREDTAAGRHASVAMAG